MAMKEFSLRLYIGTLLSTIVLCNGEYFLMTDGRLLGSRIITKQEPSSIACLFKCQREKLCETINYNYDDCLCELNSGKVEHGMVERDYKWKIYHRFHQVKLIVVQPQTTVVPLTTTVVPLTKYTISVVTGNSIGDGTDAHVKMIIKGSRGNSPELALDKSASVSRNSNLFEKGDADLFEFIIRNVGVVSSIVIWHDNSGIGPGWFLSTITIIDSSTGAEYTFFCAKELNESIGLRQKLLPK